jgi:hypothetical protein
MPSLDAPDIDAPSPLRRQWLTGILVGQLQPTPDNLRVARAFLEQKWRQRAHELARPVPRDLSGACKFAALFAQQVFGGRLQSNLDHDYVLRAGVVLDLTNAVGVSSAQPYRHDRRHHLNREHIESLELNLPRVESWVHEFLQAQGI